ncbi:MAG TPA: O-antigen ligase family protein [Chthoniobacterales bacterium]|jgi:tetratricopeptide (TPR) repeat protein|nr:O-antigen ligase family protein [Chthoniobacterales bacterium]
MENTADRPEPASGRKDTPGPMPEAFLALLPVLACFLGGATAKWGEGIIVAVLGIYLIARPPRYSLGLGLNLALLAIFLWSAFAFLPANWFYQPNWRAADFNDFGIVLPPTVTAQPWITVTWMCSLLAALSWFYVMCSERLGLREVRVALRVFTAGIVVLAAVCILFWLRHSAPPFWHNERTFGPFPNRNQTGNLFGLAAIMVLACGQDDLRKGRKRWIVWTLALGVLVAAIIINFSRAGIGILVAGCALWLGIFSLCQRRRLASRIALVVSFLLLLLTALLLFGGETLERFHLRDLHSAGISSEFRWRIFSDVFQLIHDSPFVGIGLGNFESVFAIFRVASYSDQRALHPESDWLWLWSEAGWVAVLIVIVGLAFVVPKIFPMREGTNQRYRLATLIACALFVLHGLVDVSGHRVGTVFSAIFLLGLSIHRPHSFKPSRTLSILFRVIGLILLVVGSTWVVAARGHKMLPGSLGVTNAKNLATISNRGRDFAETVAITTEALQWAPLDWQLYFYRAVAEAELKQTDNALADFRRARYLEPLSAELPLAEGNAWLRTQPVLAATAWREALRRAGSDRPGVYSSMLTKASLRNPEVSQILAEIGLSHHDLALPYLARISGPEFKRALGKVLENDPGLKSFTEPEKLALFSFWSERGDASDLTQAVNEHPDWLPYAWFGLAKARANNGDFRGAYDLAQHYGEPPALPRINSSTTDRLQLESRFRASPDSYAIGYELYRAQKKDGRIDDALETVRHFSERSNSPAYWKFIEAELWAEKQTYDRAWKALLKFHTAQSAK